MSIDDHLDTQLAEYFGWLEGRLGTTMRLPEAAPRRPRRSVALLLGAAAAVIALVAAALVVRNDDVPSIGPATSPTIDPTLPSTEPATSGSTNTPATTATTEPTGELTWAPLALPETMRVVDVRQTLDFDLITSGSTTRAQQFVRFGADGSTVEASLSLSVAPADGNEVEAWIPNGEVHGLPAIVTTPSLTQTSIWWVEAGHVVNADASGLDPNTLVNLLEATVLRADGDTGFEPTSITGDLTLLYDSDLRMPLHSTWYGIHDLERDAYISVRVAEPPRLFDIIVHRVRTGLLIETVDDVRSQWLLLTPDKVGVSIGYSPRGPAISLEQAIAIAEAMQSATPGQLHELRASAGAAIGSNSLPLLDAVAIGGRSLGLRGGTVDEPVALCLDGASGATCGFNDVHRDGDPQPDASLRSLIVDGEWFYVGYGVGSLFTTEGQTAVEYPMRVCSANADGSLISLLPDERADAHDREYMLVAVPADVEYVRVCIDANGELQPNSSRMAARPLP